MAERDGERGEEKKNRFFDKSGGRRWAERDGERGSSEEGGGKEIKRAIALNGHVTVQGSRERGDRERASERETEQEECARNGQIATMQILLPPFFFNIPFLARDKKQINLWTKKRQKKE